ncbi:alpha-N-acetylglucosaminidase [Rapidithrix thailandica]|uniref:Alpha-N-acetylglucosaminidase n=1 Tax=Rapidithrix thailandica TaxID=413964 RepID=A0AAW9S470_9BACT
MKLKIEIFFFAFCFLVFGCKTTTTTEVKHNHSSGLAVSRLAERLLPEHVSQLVFEEIVLLESGQDVFELETINGKLHIRGNNPVSRATGLNWYLKYYTHSHIAWGASQLDLPEKLPEVKTKVRKVTRQVKRYYLNYCTYSYSMAWWDWERWEKEIDWMALHGINMPLLVLGEEAVWQNTLQRLGYADSEIKEFISGPAFFAWWHMNNLEAWGGPLPDNWIKKQVVLRNKIQQRMEDYGMTPVFQGFYGMVPNSLKAKRPEANIHDPGLWCGFRRPAFLMPSDSLFDEMASIYYEEQNKLFGKAAYYGGDPFHEGGNTEGVDLAAAGKTVMAAMKKANPEAAWVLQAWHANPRQQMIEGLPQGDVTVLDLNTEDRPLWGEPNFKQYRENGFGKHEWIWCMLHNFGGNVGMYGRMERVVEGFFTAKNHPNGQQLVGIGATPEGIENNPVMYELLFELPWHDKKLVLEDWITEYAMYRYGKKSESLENAWMVLKNTVYNNAQPQQGTSESVLCARPALQIDHVSGWGSTRLYYQPDTLIQAWTEFLTVTDEFKEVDTYRYDLVDLTRQVLANRANVLHKQIVAAYKEKNKKKFQKLKNAFLTLLLDQDRLLSTREEFMLGPWIAAARAKGDKPVEKDLYEWNARVQITTWGPREAADGGSLHEYSHREWSGLLKDFYYPRWKMFFDNLENHLNGKPLKNLDFYAWEEAWTKQKNPFSLQTQGDEIEVVKALYKKYGGLKN